MEVNRILHGDVLNELKRMPNKLVDCIVTSPPYWGLRDYGVDGQIGLEPTLTEYISKLLRITAELKRVLKPTGVMFWNHGDCYGNTSTGGQGATGGLDKSTLQSAMPPKNTTPIKRGSCGVPEKCLALQNYRLILRMIDEQGWILRNAMVWHKPNSMPSSVKDRFANSYEPVFMLVKQQKYWFDLDAVRKPHNQASIERAKNPDNPRQHGKKMEKTEWHSEQVILDSAGKNPGDVWTIATQSFAAAHFATFPEKLIEPMILAGCPEWICKKCGKARVRISEKEFEPAHSRGKNFKQVKGTNSKTSGKAWKDKGWNELPALKIKDIKTLGWTDCGCKAGWQPGIVLDPFAGAGTSCVVAKKLGRRWLGIELNADYVKMAEKRIVNTMGRLL